MAAGAAEAIASFTMADECIGGAPSPPPAENELDRRNPGAMDLVRRSFQPKDGRPVSAWLRELHQTIPQVISKRLDYSMSKRVLTAMLEDVVDEVQTHVERKYARKMRRHLVASEGLSVFSGAFNGGPHTPGE